MTAGDDARPWVVRFESFGVRLEVGVHDAALVPAMSRVLPPVRRAVREAPTVGRLSITRGAEGHEIFIDGRCVAVGLAGDQAVSVVDAHVRGRIAENAPDHVFVHAGVVVVDGRALVLPGRSFAGKTSLVAALIARGATYYSDEFAVLDGDGRVHAYPKPLSIRPEGGGRGRPTEPSTLGPSSGGDPAPVRLVADLSYRAGAAWEPRPLTEGQAALALFRNTVPARVRPGPSLAVAGRAAAGAVAIAGDRGEAGATADILLRLMADVGIAAASAP